jgi:hypothetical protein
MLRGLCGDCYAGFPGQQDPAFQECWKDAPTGFNGLSGMKATQAVRQYLKCLSATMGLTERTLWDEAFHADVYAKIHATIFGTDMPSFPGEWGDRPDDTARIIANYPTMMVADGDSFWDCIGVAKTDAVSSMRDQDGDYYALVVQVALYVNGAEGGISGTGGVLPTPSIVGGLVVAALGISGLMLLGRR